MKYLNYMADRVSILETFVDDVPVIMAEFGYKETSMVAKSLGYFTNRTGPTKLRTSGVMECRYGGQPRPTPQQPKPSTDYINDLFIGHSSHISARYKITFDNYSENQSSSGIIISTGAGSTGWLSSLFNMAAGINRTFGKVTGETHPLGLSMTWDEKQLVFIVREPFLSKYSRIDLTTGLISPKKKLVLESFMPTNGVIFSDGIEADFLHFNSGSIAEIGIAKERALIVQK